jgi:glycosyltransferase involved in cell wall biosynthesis
MKLVIQIPCFNEEGALAATLSALPRTLPEIDKIEWLVVDDGSTDSTVAIAKSCGVDHVISFPRNRGLAKAFMAGLEESLNVGADLILNLDADNQYCADDIPKLIRPLLEGKAEMVIGARQINEIHHFSPFKKQLQKLGSMLVRLVSKTNVEDAPSGFRCMSRRVALRLNVFNDYTYTLETIIQAGRQGISIVSVPIRTNPQLRQSRLVKSTADYVRRSAFTILRIFMIYCPMRFFFLLGAIPFSLGLLLGTRWVLFFWNGRPASHIPSLVLTAIFIMLGVQLWIVGLIASLQAINRVLIEDVQIRVRESKCPAKDHLASP